MLWEVPSTRNLLETPSAAQSLDGYCRLEGSLRFPGPTLVRPAGVRYGELAANVSQVETSPLLNPVWNERLRCSDVPWVKALGTTSWFPTEPQSQPGKAQLSANAERWTRKEQKCHWPLRPIRC